MKTLKRAAKATSFADGNKILIITFQATKHLIYQVVNVLQSKTSISISDTIQLPCPPILILISFFHLRN